MSFLTINTQKINVGDCKNDRASLTGEKQTGLFNNIYVKAPNI